MQPGRGLRSAEWLAGRHHDLATLVAEEVTGPVIAQNVPVGEIPVAAMGCES